MAHYYNLPLFGVGGRTDSKTLDVQTGIEYALSTFIETLCSSGMIHDVGYLATGLISSYEMVVMGNELIGMIKRFMKSLDINSETLVLDVINKVGPNGKYLPNENTQKYLFLWIQSFLCLNHKVYVCSFY